ncbi:unnamed protein product [Effrenium voratum]|uniref:Uncharacterized protein n=1 Tax=Effrenium voratum TaxID=2562239 RepID=A0AA36JHV9_9DINO|nr:unnamed protein product [Effrenium voratum]
MQLEANLVPGDAAAFGPRPRLRQGVLEDLQLHGRAHGVRRPVYILPPCPQSAQMGGNPHEDWALRLSRAWTGGDSVLSMAEHREVQELINWSWIKGVNFECILGIIALRLLSFGYSDPLQFNANDPDFGVLDFLDTFNAHSGALDLLTSSWAALLAGGWPVFKELHLVGKKLMDVMDDRPMKYPGLQTRPNECDELDSEEDLNYRDALVHGLASGEMPVLGIHLLAIRRSGGCPAGNAVALLAVALDLINRGTYQGSLKDSSNMVYALIVTAQDTISSWVTTKSNWSPFFDLLTTRWPLWEMLSRLACVDSTRPCVTRSALQCYDFLQRQHVPCPHQPPELRSIFVGCGEHDICTWPVMGSEDPTSWCVAHERRVPDPRRPWLRELSHDLEERVCSQCGQDGVLRAIFRNVGFRDEGSQHPFYVEFGSRKPGMLNSAVLRELWEFCNWRGVLLDSQPGETPHGRDCPGVAMIATEPAPKAGEKRAEPEPFVTAENVVELFQKYEVPRDFDLLTIDTDYNDYWIWRALLTDGTFKPRVVAVDFNPDISLQEAKVVRYSPLAEWDGTVYTVGSLLAYSLLARAHGYSFAYALEMGSHAFFVRADLLHEDPKKRDFVDVLYDFIPGIPVNGDVDSKTGRKRNPGGAMAIGLFISIGQVSRGRPDGLAGPWKV